MTSMSDSRESIDPKSLECEDDPVLALVGLGKEYWLNLGGGEKILAWLRSDDPAARPPWEEHRTPKK